MSFAPQPRIETDATPQNHVRLLRTLQELMALPTMEPADALNAAAQRIAEALACEKVDAFLLDESKQTLVAVGTSDTPLGRRQKALGLDLLPLANGGRVVEVFKSGASYLDGDVERDPNELPGIIVELGVRSSLSAVLDVNGVRRGVLCAVSTKRDAFQPVDLSFLEAAARWIGMLTHRAELAVQARSAELEQGRRAGADEVITVLAHDVRNHLHPLLARLQLMRMHVEGGEAVSLGEIDKATRSVQRLARLSEDLLDLRRLDEGLFSMNLDTVDIVALSRETAASLATASVPVRVTGPDQIVLIGDADRLRQAIENLVSNAIKYSPPGKPVQVHLRARSVGEGDQDVLVEVIDEGPGIAPKMQPVLFERFVSDAKSRGLGLGLYLARRIAREHEGDVTVESTLGAGSKFRLELPLSPRST
ncbi:MAG TPA: GAF domain-containing sensor histidine kinase [Polyangiaceae bacterium]|jgi:signal transduction histidine kinase|nr:GAF domain-containing sensor histidine kinase [Polyangiaceae bacterium]